MPPTRLQAVDVRKTYGGTVALDGINVVFEGGRVHALIGKNGAGKSTLVKIISGAVQPTRGTVRLDGAALRLRSPRDALQQGIAAVYQELSLVPELTVGENILFGRMPKYRGLGRGIIDWRQVDRRSREVLERIGVDLDVRAKVGRLGMARQQLVEIAKAMSFRPRVLLLDEPTSALAHHEVERLFPLVRGLARQGVAVIYISHRLHELPQVADTVSVLRDGHCVGTIGIQEATSRRLAGLMFGEAAGRASSVSRPRPDAGAGDAPAAPAVLEVRSLTRPGKLHDVSFRLHAGEVLGIAGLLGSGRTELLTAIFGAEPPQSGEVLIDGRAVRRPSPRVMSRLGLGLTPEDRKRHALVPRLSVRDNLCLAALRRISWFGMIWKRRQRPVVEGLVRRLQIALSSPEQQVAHLSGGNQQKVVVGKWLATQPKVLLFDEPTRGIDVAAKQQIFDIIRELSRQGIACIFVSSELEELAEVCHRVLVMRNGRIVGELPAQGLSADRLFRACMEP